MYELPPRDGDECPFKNVSHTPEQKAGFSDTDLQNILERRGPRRGLLDPTVPIPSCDGGPDFTAQACMEWQSFHQWTDITADELPGIICYLRALAPQPQDGTSNFGAGGGHHRDGGGGGGPFKDRDFGGD